MAIERKFIQQNIREHAIRRFVEETVERVGLSDVKVKKTPLGDKIVIHASRPGLVVGRGGANIQELTKRLKAEFNLENPQIEIEEVAKPDLDADIVCERVVNSLERFGSGRTKGIGHRAMEDSMRAGALGVEILITGKIPSMRARRWRFYQGYLKKAGDLAVEGVQTSIKSVTLKSGVVGVQVSIMGPDIRLPDNITLTEAPVTEVQVTEDGTDVTEKAVAESEDLPAEEPEAKAEEKPAKKEATPAKEEPKSEKPAEAKASEDEKAPAKEVSASETKEDSDAKEQKK